MSTLRFPAIRTVVILAVVSLAAYPVIAHHPAADIVDEEIYEMIDSMVADTPHADMVFEDMTPGMTEIGIVGRVTDLETLIANDLLSYVGLLDGEVSVTIEFTGMRSASLTILQVEDAASADKVAVDDNAVSFGDVKATYR